MKLAAHDSGTFASVGDQLESQSNAGRHQRQAEERSEYRGRASECFDVVATL
jgi:hypothetical protein